MPGPDGNSRRVARDRAAGEHRAQVCVLCSVLEREMSWWERERAGYFLVRRVYKLPRVV